MTDNSSTWMFPVEDGRLRFRHEHRHDDDTPDEITMHDGYGNGKTNYIILCGI